jgi:hypothetical protein
MAHELEELVALGYPPLEALRVATHANVRNVQAVYKGGVKIPPTP